MKAKYTIVIRKSRFRAGFWWRILHSNGQIIATSETYTRKASAVKAAGRFAVWIQNHFRLPIIDKTK